eukprot:Skav229773  [mRNA]  locus=scaffold519:29455:30642:+ [translate_table: standard]
MAQHGACARALVCAHVVCEILCHFVVLGAAWFTTAYIIAGYLAAHFLLALMVSEITWWELLQVPLLWLFPPGTGRLMLPSRDSQRSRLGPMFRFLSWCLRLAVLGWAYGSVQTAPYIPCTESHDCKGLPHWLRQPWWSENAKCPVTPYNYNNCMQQLPKYLQGTCNARAGRCYLSENCAPWLRVVAGACLAIGPLLALPASLLLSAALCALFPGDLENTKGPQRAEPVELVEASSGEESEKVNVVERLKFFLKQLRFFGLTLSPFVLDVFSDLNGILQFILTGNFYFAMLSSSIFAMSVAQQLRIGFLGNFWQTAVESLRQARSTRELQAMMLSEKSVEAAAQLLLQYYAFEFVTSSEFAVCSFVCSMALSLKGVAEAVYNLIELGLYKEFEQLA